MSGASPDDLTKQEIMERLEKLKVNALANNDRLLLAKINKLLEDVYRLETY